MLNNVEIRFISTPKCRKTLPRWTEKVRVFAVREPEVPVNDEYSWRKYGKNYGFREIYLRICRHYYRCTHRQTKGCKATKRVQRSDEDPLVFKVMYQENHNCIEASNSTSVTVSHENEKVTANGDNFLQQLEEKEKQEQDIHFQFGQGLKVETEELASKEDVCPSFSFPSTPIESENLESEIFWEPFEENIFLGSYSPATSESNYFSMSPCQMNNYGRGHKGQGSESDLIDINSTSTAVTNWPFDLDFSIAQMNFDLPLGSRDYFT